MQLGFDPETHSWRSRAACRGVDPEVFFPPKGDHSAKNEALRWCQSCSVRDECLEANVHIREGIYGGTTGRDRRALRRGRVFKRRCGFCDRLFLGPMDNRQYCSDDCREAARNRVKAESRVRRGVPRRSRT